MNESEVRKIVRSEMWRWWKWATVLSFISMVLSLLGLTILEKRLGEEMEEELIYRAPNEVDSHEQFNATIEKLQRFQQNN